MNGKKILFLEDEPVAQSVYRNRLQREGFETLFAEDGEMALNSLSQGRPDLVVLDLMLPRANGPEVLKHIRSEERLKETPVLILSNDYVTGQSQKAMESGATRGLLKAECTPARLAEAVRDMLGFRSAFDLTDKPVTDESQSQAFAAAAAEAFADEMNLKETRGEFVKKAPGEIAKIRDYCLAYINSETAPAGLEHLNNLFQHVRFFSTRAGLSGSVRIALLAGAFEALLFEIVFKPERANASTLQTVAQAVDCLERLCQKNEPGIVEPGLKAKILIVDDDAINNHAMMAALKRAHFEPDSFDDAAKAIQTAQDASYDIVLLDINMQGINGFELCEKLRAMPQYKETPIIFVSANGDFQDRARGILCGGNDLILKPVSPVELVLKTTMRLLQPQGLWAETSVAASALNTTTRMMHPESSAPAALRPLSPNGSTSDAPVRLTPDAADNKPSFSTEMLRRAWGGESHELPKPDEKEKSDHNAATNGVVKTTLPEVKEELPKADATVTADKPADIEDTIKPAALEIAVEPLKLVEETKPDLTNEINKSSEPKPSETKNEPPKIEISVVADDAPKTDAPAVLADKTDSENNNQTKPTDINMETKNKPTFDEAARGIARIIFGDEHASDMNVRLTRIALESYNVPGTQKFDDVARGVARIIFGDDKVSDMNVRLTRIALERYNITDVFHHPNGSAKPAENGAPKA